MTRIVGGDVRSRFPQKTNMNPKIILSILFILSFVIFTENCA